MSMPRFFALSAGSVVQCSTTSAPRLTICTTAADIKSLHRYFRGPSPVAKSVADEIVAYKFDIDAGGASGEIVFSNHTIRVPKGKYKIRIIASDPSASPSSATKAWVAMTDGNCYWLEPAYKKPASKKRAKRKKA